MVSPQVQSDSASAAIRGRFEDEHHVLLQLSGELVRDLARAVMIGPSSPAPRPCIVKSLRAPAAGPLFGAAASPISVACSASSFTDTPGLNVHEMIENLALHFDQLLMHRICESTKTGCTPWER